MISLDLRSTLQQYEPTLVQFRFYGLSTEDKPTTGADGETLPIPCTWESLDTEEKFLWNGTLWEKQEQAPTTPLARVEEALGEIASLLRRLVYAKELEHEEPIPDPADDEEEEGGS